MHVQTRPSPSPRKRVAGLTLSAVLLVSAAASAGSPNPFFRTQRHDPTFHLPDYPIVFVAAEIHEEQITNQTGFPCVGGMIGRYNIGTDVLFANRPSPGHQLWILLPTGKVEQLFPLAVHDATNGLIDTPTGALHLGSVVEPNVSEDGRALYFSYFHDAAQVGPKTKLPRRGADLYRLDLGPLIDDPGRDPSTLQVTRLTFRSQNPPDAADWDETAMNVQEATVSEFHDWGTVFMHAIEMRQDGELKLVYVSDERRLQNSNAQRGSPPFANHNFNLHIADIAADGSLENARQFQYYTTTSALSPTPLREGLAFSYQASTAAPRNWHIQAIDSAGRWAPLIGYGSNPELYHLGAFCVDDGGRDYFIVSRYYNTNNKGFGALWRQSLDPAVLGKNTYDDHTDWGTVPQQVGAINITPDTPSADEAAEDPSGLIVHGKYTSPRCGRPNELYMAYSPTTANGKECDNAGNVHIYDSHIAYRPNLEAFDPLSATGLQTVVDEVGDGQESYYNLLWPVPILPWTERTGDRQQRSSPPIIDPDTAIQPGLPHAQVGTSALWNTDRVPFDCWLRRAALGPQDPFSPYPTQDTGQETDLILENTDGLTLVQDFDNPCLPLAPKHVLGIAINMTSNKAYMKFHDNPGYETGFYAFDAGNPGPITPGNAPGLARQEISKLLGVFDVRGHNDQSFQAMIPANVPFEFHLLDSTYGLKLTDVRSWHSLKPRETRTNCGGCHQHDDRATAYPFAGTEADMNPPVDFTSSTPHLTYDADCKPILVASPEPALRPLEWKKDIYRQLHAYCGACHGPSAPKDLGTPGYVFGFSDEQTAYGQLIERRFADPRMGAIGSPLFWAARGRRTDGRDNDDPKFERDINADVWGYFHTSSHGTDPGLCATGDPVKARWVYDLGRWIDNQMPRGTGDNEYDTDFDWYHPTVDVAIPPASGCTADPLQVGVWDDSGTVAEVEVRINGTTHATLAAVSNGSRLLPTPGLANSDIVEVIATDAQGNRQRYSKRVAELRRDCQVIVGP